MFRDLFDIFKESTQWIDEFEKFVEDNEKKESCKKDDENHSYYHYVSDKYEDGKHVSHNEKEVKDGKVVKDVHDSINIEDKNEKKCSENKPSQKTSNYECIKKLKDDVNHFAAKCECLNERNKKLEKKIEMLEDINNKLQVEKNNLEIKLESIKAMF